MCGCGADTDARAASSRIVPEDLSVMALEGGNGVLDVTGLTLRRGSQALEVFAALKNVGDVPACSAAFSIELFDRQEQSVAAGITGLLSQHFFRLTDGSETTAACVAPGDVTMAAITDLPAELAVEDIGTIVYRCPYFALDVVPIDGLEVDRVERVQAGGETSFAGRVVNRFDVTVENPSVSVFPIDRSGRPLGMVSVSEALELSPRGRWDFKTPGIAAADGDDYAVFPAGAIDE